MAFSMEVRSSWLWSNPSLKVCKFFAIKSFESDCWWKIWGLLIKTLRSLSAREKAFTLAEGSLKISRNKFAGSRRIVTEKEDASGVELRTSWQYSTQTIRLSCEDGTGISKLADWKKSLHIFHIQLLLLYVIHIMYGLAGCTKQSVVEKTFMNKNFRNLCWSCNPWYGNLI